MNVADYYWKLFEMAIIQGAYIIVGAVILGYIVKRIKVIPNDFIPVINAVVGGFIGVMEPSFFTGLVPVAQAILGMTCGYIASPFYDKVVYPLEDIIIKKFLTYIKRFLSKGEL